MSHITFIVHTDIDAKIDMNMKSWTHKSDRNRREMFKSIVGIKRSINASITPDGHNYRADIFNTDTGYFAYITPTN